MVASNKCLRLFPKLDFQGPRDSFFGSIWWHSKLLQYLGLIPLNLTSTENSIEVKENKTYFLKVFIANAIFVSYSYIHMKHDHLKQKNPVMLHITNWLLVTISSTAVVGTINIFMKREEFRMVRVKVGVILT